MAKKSDRDSNQQAADAIAAATDMPPPTGVYEALLKRQAAKKLQRPAKNAAAVALGRLGGLKGGKARAASLTAEERREIAANAARKRWANKMATPVSLGIDEQRYLKYAQQGLPPAEIQRRMKKTEAELLGIVHRALAANMTR